MSLIQRIRRRLGRDTTKTFESSNTRYLYTATHLDDEEKEVEAHRVVFDNGMAIFQEVSSFEVGTVLGISIYKSYTEKKVLGSIKEIDKEKIGTTICRAVIDKADNSLVEKGTIEK